MSAVRWAIGLVVFAAVLLLSLQNADPVTIRFYHWFAWQAPLIVLLLLAFAAGALAGLLTGLMRTARLRRQLSRLRRVQPRDAPPPADGS